MTEVRHVTPGYSLPVFYTAPYNIRTELKKSRPDTDVRPAIYSGLKPVVAVYSDITFTERRSLPSRTTFTTYTPAVPRPICAFWPARIEASLRPTSIPLML